jgi:hypothetical protein
MLTCDIHKRTPERRAIITGLHKVGELYKRIQIPEVTSIVLNKVGEELTNSLDASSTPR